MKKLLLSLVCFVFFIGTAVSQITNPHLNDFNDGTTQGWSNGPGSPNPPTNVNNFLEEVSAGGSGAGSKLAVFNVGTDITGDYTAAGILSVEFDAKTPTGDDLFLRVGIKGGSDDTEIVTTSFVTVPGSSDWNSYILSIEAVDFIVDDGSNTIGETLADVKEIRILHNPNPSFPADAIAATLHLDNINISDAVLGLNENALSSLKLFPNPAKDFALVTAKDKIDSYRLYSVLGALIEEVKVNASSFEIDLRNRPTGIYLLELNAGNAKQVQKLIKK